MTRSTPVSEPCGNIDCDLCYPLPRWHVRHVVVLRRKHLFEVKAATIEEARTLAEKLDQPSSYSQSVVEDQPILIEPLDQESLQQHAEHAALRCFHSIRARDGAKPTRFPRPVVCEWCKNSFRAIYFDESADKQTQGDDCAASVYQKEGSWYVAGHYGSGGFDMMRLRFIATHPTQPLDPVCDQCINERIAAGDLVTD
jgi:hypothetical protein